MNVAVFFVYPSVVKTLAESLDNDPPDKFIYLFQAVLWLGYIKI